MTYDEYTLKVRARVRKFHKFELWLKKHKIAVIAVTVLLFVLAFAAVYFSGSFIRGLKDRKMTYGDAEGDKALAFLSGVNVSYTDNGEETEGFPFLAGEYDVSAKTVNLLGVTRQSDAHYSIAKRRAAIILHDFTVEYGAEPENVGFSSEGLAEGDTAYITQIKFDKTAKQSDAYISGIVIKNKDGKDVTASYELTLNGATATVTKRKITVVTGSAGKKWDKEPLICHEYKIESGSLADGEVIYVNFTSSLDMPGIETNKAEVKIFDGGKDVTDRYAVTLKYGTLYIQRRIIKIETGSAEKEYDKEPLFCTDYKITESELMDGHRIVITDYPTIINVGKIKNNVAFKVENESDGEDMKLYYDITVTAGTLTVKARELVIRTKSYEFEYDSTVHYPVDEIEIISGELYEGDTLTAGKSSGYLSAGEYNSKCSLTFGDAVPADSYAVTFDYGRVTVRKKPISLVYRIYGDPSRSPTHFTAVGTASDTYYLGAYDNFAATSVNIKIPVTVDYDDFEDYIRSNIKIINSTTGYNPSDETKSYEISLELKYDENELDEFKATVTEPDKDPEHNTGTSVVTEPYETETETTKEVEKTPEEIYGENGIGSAGIGGGINNSPSPYSDLPSDTPKQNKEPLGTVKSYLPGAVYLRLRSFGDYTGTGWAEPAVYNTGWGESPLDYTLNALEKNGYMTMNDISVRYSVKDGLAPVPYYAAYEYDTSFTLTDVAVPRKNTDGDAYFFYGQIPIINVNIISTLKGNAAYEMEYRDFVYDHYLSLPEQTKDAILKIIEEAGLDRSSPTVLSDVAEYVRHAAQYSGSFARIPDGEDRVIYFLTESKEGICGHFASAATVIYRALGIPARYTVGYYVVCDGGFEETAFYTKDAHAWVEIYIDDVGWVPVDATGSSVSESGRGSELQPPDTKSEIFYNKLRFKMKDASKSFDGEPLYSTEAEILGGGNLKEGHRIEAKTLGITYCGTLQTRSTEFHVYDESGADVTGQYQITERAAATLYVTPMNVLTPDITLYVGQTIKVPDYAEITDPTVALLIGEDKIDFEFVTDQTLFVDGKELSGIAATVSNTYHRDFDLGYDEYQPGGPWSQYDDLGNDIRIIQNITVLPFENVRIKDGEPDLSNTEDRITGENGQIYNYIVLRSTDAEKPFDGTYLISDEYEILSGTLPPGYTVKYESSAALLYVGEVKNLFSYLCVLDDKGMDVTSDYIIDFYPGTLRVLSGEYITTDPVVTVEVNGEYDLNGLVWVEDMSNLPVTYESTGEGGIVRVQNKSVIGIEPGKTHITSYLNGVDLNGDGINEYLPAKRQLTVNVSAGKETDNTFIYIILIVTIAVAVAAVTFLMINTSNAKKKNGTDFVISDHK